MSKDVTMIVLLREQFWGWWGELLCPITMRLQIKREKIQTGNICSLPQIKSLSPQCGKAIHCCIHRLKQFWIKLSPALRNKPTSLCSCSENNKLFKIFSKLNTPPTGLLFKGKVWMKTEWASQQCPKQVMGLIRQSIFTCCIEVRIVAKFTKASATQPERGRLWMA